MSSSTTCVFLTLLTLTFTDGVQGWVSDGSNFIVACPSVPSATPSVDCTLHVMGSEGVLVNLTGSVTGLPMIKEISSALILRLTLQGNYPNSQAIVVTTTEAVSIFVEHNSQAGVSAYLSIPMGTDLTLPYTGSTIENFLMSPPIPNSEENIYVMASAYENTVVTLTLKSTGSFTHDSATYSDGGTLSVTLGGGGVLEIITGKDLTGTVVTSSHPVTLFMGTIVEPSFEQIPPESMWGTVSIVMNIDICTESTVRVISPLNGVITNLKMSGDVTLTMTKGVHQEVQSNETSVIMSLKHLLLLSCTIGNKRMALFNSPGDDQGTEFKCLALAGYDNTAFLIGLKIVDHALDINGVEVNFTIVDTYEQSAFAGTAKGPVDGEYVIMKALDAGTFTPAIIGFNAQGAYALACAMGGLGSLLPDPLHSLIDVALAVFSPSPTEPSPTLEVASSSDVNVISSSPLDIFSSSDVIFYSSSDVIFHSSSDVSYGVDVSLASFAMSSLGDDISVLPSSVIYTASTSVITSSVTTTEAALNLTFPTSEEVCFCQCGENQLLPEETKAFLEEYDIEIKKNLTLDTKTLSSYIRTKTSADDYRPSAQNVGYFGVVMLCIPFVFLIFSDMLNIFQMTSKKK